MSNKKHTLLLVEDEQILSNLYYAVLHKQYNLLMASNLAAAEKILVETKPELILLDLIFPTQVGVSANYGERSGFTLLKKIKNIPTIIFTNLDSPQDKEKAVALGAIEYVVKSNILPAQLLAKIDKILDK